MPKEGDKCDIKPLAFGEKGYFTPGTVTAYASSTKQN